MLSIGIIIFREILEIAIILGVILVATRCLKNRKYWIWAGLAGGVIGSGLVAAFANQISRAAEGMGQEIFNAIVLISAAVLIGWTVVWMQRHGRLLSQYYKKVGQQVVKGEKPLYTLAIIIALAVLREGSEIVLFTHGVIASGEHISRIIFGGTLGLVAGTAVGMALYYGLIKISAKRIFSVTSWMLMLLAAGMISQAAGLLSAGGFLPELVYPVWDTSHILSENSLIGNIFHVLLGYTERPSGIQLVCYVFTVFFIGLALRVYGRPAVLPASDQMETRQS